MKNILKKTLLFVTIFTFGLASVEAYDVGGTKTVDDMVDSKTAVLVCEYANSSGTVFNRIYYMFESSDGSWTPGPWDVYYRKGEKENDFYHIANAFTGDIISRGSFYEALQRDQVSYNSDENRMPNEMEAVFTCPTYAFTDLDNFDEICYGDNQSCGDNFEYGPFTLTKNGNTIFEKIDNYIVALLDNDEFVSAIRNKTDITNTLRQRARNYVITTWPLSSNYKMPAFIDNYLNNLAVDENNPKLAESFNTLKQKAVQAVENEVRMGVKTEEEATQEKAEIEQLEVKDIIKVKSEMSADLNINSGTNCNSILGQQMSEIVKNLFTFIQYLGPILVAVFSIMDFIKAAASGDEGQMKKASEKLMKRIICGILLFFVPLICSFLMDLGGLTMPDICIKQKR